MTVVDNASGDGSAELVARRVSRGCALIRNTRRTSGSARRTTRRCAASTARYLLVLNSDATAAPGALADAGRLPGRAPGRGGGRAAAALSGRHGPAVAAALPDGGHVVRARARRCSASGPTTRVLRRYYVADRSDDEEQDVDWLAGACLCVRARAAADVGLFDERFFMYSEELDLCRRFRAAGWRVAYVPSAEVSAPRGRQRAARPGGARPAVSDVQAAVRARSGMARGSRARLRVFLIAGILWRAGWRRAQAGARLAAHGAARAAGGDRQRALRHALRG